MVGRTVRGNDGRKVDLGVLIAGMDNISASQGRGITWESQGGVHKVSQKDKLLSKRITRTNTIRRGERKKKHQIRDINNRKRSHFLIDSSGV